MNTELLHYSELTLKGVFHNTPEFVKDSLGFINQNRDLMRLMLSDTRSLGEVGNAFEDMRDRKVIKVAIVP